MGDGSVCKLLMTIGFTEFAGSSVFSSAVRLRHVQRRPEHMNKNEINSDSATYRLPVYYKGQCMDLLEREMQP